MKTIIKELMETYEITKENALEIYDVMVRAKERSKCIIVERT